MKRFRSAISGQWVTRLFAKRNPATTVSETTGTTTIISGSVPTFTPCGYCGKLIDWSEGMCRYCGSELDE